MSSPFSSCRTARDYLVAAERVDPAGHAMHLAAALAWACAAGVSNAAEGITWGILAAVSIARVPKIRRCWRPIVADPLWIALGCWSAWLCLATAFAAVAPEGWRPFLPERRTLTPLLLWPVLNRPMAVLIALGIGSAVQLASVLVSAWWTGALRPAPMAEGLASFGQWQWQVLVAVALGMAGLRWIKGGLRWSMVPILVGAGLAIDGGARRFSALAAFASAGLVWLRPPLGARARTWAVCATLLVIAGCLLLLSSASHRAQHGFRAGQSAQQRAGTYAAIDAVSGARFALSHAAASIGAERPIFGHGRDSFKRLLPEWAARERVAHPERARALDPLRNSRLNDAHNALLGTFVEGGLPAAALLGAVLLGLAWRLWRQSRYDPLAGVSLALHSAVLLGAFSQPSSTKSPGAILALCLAISVLPRRAR